MLVSGSTACDGIAATSRRPSRSSCTAATLARAVSRLRTASRAGSIRALPASVSTALRPMRWNSSEPRSRSSARTACDSDGCDTYRADAARLNPPRSTIARKYSSCRMSIRTLCPGRKSTDDSIGPDHGGVKDRLDEVRTTDAPAVIPHEARSQPPEALNDRLRHPSPVTRHPSPGLRFEQALGFSHVPSPTGPAPRHTQYRIAPEHCGPYRRSPVRSSRTKAPTPRTRPVDHCGGWGPADAPCGCSLIQDRPPMSRRRRVRVTTT